MSTENFMTAIKKNPVTTGLISFAVLAVLIIVIVMMKTDKKNTPKPTTKEGFSLSDTFSLSNMTQEDLESIGLGAGNEYENYENNENYEDEIVENFPQPAPMNVMYSDANGNLATTTDLGLQNLTISKDGALLIGNKFRFNANKDFWGDDKWLRMSNADNTGYSGSGADGGFAAQNLYAADTIYAQTANIRGNSSVAGSISATGSISAGSISTGGSLSAGTTNVGQFTAGSISSNGNISSGGKLQEGGNALIPRGTIVMWNGATAPAGWAICDGGNSTPDLRNRFIVGSGSGSIYGVGETGGAKEVTLTVAQMPKHSHKFVWGSTNWGDGNEGGRGATAGWGWNSKIDDTRENPGGDQPHENRPPYYALCYIMKL